MSIKKPTAKKPWSITTTIRNPDRLRGLITFFKNFGNQTWDKEKQADYQISLIRGRFYGYKSAQFYKDLSDAQKKLIEDITKEISYNEAKEIFYAKSYEDPPMRGRVSMSPLKKLGFITVSDDKIKITDFGKKLLDDKVNIDELVFYSFLKWQIPNPISKDYRDENIYNIKPFIGTMHLINLVNKKEALAGRKTKGLSKEEFCLFAPTLIHYKNIENYAEKIIKLRREHASKDKADRQKNWKNYKKEFALEFMEGNEKLANKLLNNLKDYGDNAIRYFRLTGYFHIRGNGYYIDLEPRRNVEIKSLLDADDASAITFENAEEYQEYLGNLNSYPLPWQNKETYSDIIKETIGDIREIEKDFGRQEKQFEAIPFSDEKKLENYIADLRTYRKQLLDMQIHSEMQNIEKIKENTALLKDIRKQENKALLLEKLSAYALYALNDAEKIKPNYPVGDDNEPTFTAPGGVADIECFYKDFNAICEVTMLASRNQWFNEGQPVMRHLREFEDKHPDKSCYCLFIAPSIHNDTLNTFWFSMKQGYQGGKQKIVPLSIKDFTVILDFLVTVKENGKDFQQSHIHKLYDGIVEMSDSFENSLDWKAEIPKAIEAWKDTFEL